MLINIQRNEAKTYISKYFEYLFINFQSLLKMGYKEPKHIAPVFWIGGGGWGDCWFKKMREELHKRIQQNQ